MEQTENLLTEDVEAYNVLEYRLGKWLDPEWLDALGDAIAMINKGEEQNPRLGGPIVHLTDDIAKLPHGSYVRLRWSLEIADPTEVEEELARST